MRTQRAMLCISVALHIHFFICSHTFLYFFFGSEWVCFVKQEKALDTTALYSLPLRKRGIIFLCWLLGWRTAISHAGKYTCAHPHTHTHSVMGTHTHVYIKIHISTLIPSDPEVEVLGNYDRFREMNTSSPTSLQRLLINLPLAELWMCCFSVSMHVGSLRNCQI